MPMEFLNSKKYKTNWNLTFKINVHNFFWNFIINSIKKWIIKTSEYQGGHKMIQFKLKENLLSVLTDKKFKITGEILLSDSKNL